MVLASVPVEDNCIKGISRVIMSPAEYKMQPTIQQEEKPDIYRLHV
jgi:hypothetical protein